SGHAHHPLMVLPFTLSQRCLHPGNCLLPGGLFLPAPLLPLERKCALRAVVSSVVRGTWSFGFARVFFGLVLGPSPTKSVGRPACSLNGPFRPPPGITQGNCRHQIASGSMR